MAEIKRFHYRRRQPEKTVLYQVVRKYVETFLALGEMYHDKGYPAYVEKDLRGYLECGILAHGFARVRCPSCGTEHLVAFSCKGRGVCPSCRARRMSDTAAHLVDRVLPRLRYRQWVMSFPFRHRFAIAKDAKILSRVLTLTLRSIFSWQRRMARAQGIDSPLCGSVTFCQRFGGALNSNPHFHSLLPDGVFTLQPEQGLTFHQLAPPTDEQIHALALKIGRRVERELDPEIDEVAIPEAEAMDTALAVSRTTQRQQSSLWTSEFEPLARPRCANIDGYSLHADVSIAEDDREALERLCRYGLRAPFAMHRFSELPDGKIQYRLKRQWYDGSEALTLTPLELLARLASLIPPPYSNLTRYHGIFGSNANGRRELQALLPQPIAEPAAAETNDAEQTDEQLPLPIRQRYLPWAALLRRVFAIDLICPACAGPMKLIAQITDPKTIAAILNHLGLPSTPPQPEPADLEPEQPQQEEFFDDDWLEYPPDATGRGPP